MNYRNLTAKILAVKTHVFVAILFIANNEWKLRKYCFEYFSPQFSWCKEAVFISPNTAPSRGLLYNSEKKNSFQRTMPNWLQFLSILQNLTFRCVLFQMYYRLQQSPIQKKVLTSDLFTTNSWNNIHGQCSFITIFMFNLYFLCFVVIWIGRFYI